MLLKVGSRAETAEHPKRPLGACLTAQGCSPCLVLSQEARPAAQSPHLRLWPPLLAQRQPKLAVLSWKKLFLAFHPEVGENGPG